MITLGSLLPRGKCPIFKERPAVAVLVAILPPWLPVVNHFFCGGFLVTFPASLPAPPSPWRVSFRSTCGHLACVTYRLSTTFSQFLRLGYLVRFLVVVVYLVTWW